MFDSLKQILSSVFFQQIYPILRLGRAKPIQVEDLPTLPATLDPRALPKDSMEFATDSGTALWKSLVRYHKRTVAIMLLLILSSGLLGWAVPPLIFHLVATVKAIADNQGSVGMGVGLGVLLALCAAGRSIMGQHYFHVMLKNIISIQNSVNLRLYRKALSVTRQVRLNHPTGDVVNYFSNDSHDVAAINEVLVGIAEAALTIIVVTGMLFYFLGSSAMAALVSLLILTPLSKTISKRFVALDHDLMRERDRRVSYISQCLHGIRIAKYFAWENRLLQEVEEIRAQEVGVLRKLAWFQSFSFLFYLATNSIVSVVTFGVHLARGGSLDAATVFSAIALFSLLDHPFGILPGLIARLSSIQVAAKRIAGYLQQEEVPEDPRAPSAPHRPIGVTLQNATCRYDDGTSDVLRDISLTVAPGEKLAIVGPVGSGKTSLLLTLLDELPLRSGRLSFQGIDGAQRPRLAYVPQEAFLQNASLADNILLGESPDILDDSLKLSALAQDIQRFPAGVKTEVGEHGINLSGGQRQRVGLARAIAYRPGLVIMDDPLSAVDHRTEDQLAHKLLFQHWDGITQIMVTHRTKYLRRFDKIALLEDGVVMGLGTYEELLATCPRFSAFIATHHDETNDVKTPVSTESSDEHLPAQGQEEPLHRITEDEDRAVGAVKKQIFWTYIKLMGGEKPGQRNLVLALLVIAVLSMMAAPMLQNLWLSVWTNGDEAAKGPMGGITNWLRSFRGDDQANFTVFAVLAMMALVIIFAQNLLWTLRSVEVGRILHARSLAAVLKTPLRFFDATPVGRILNRFSRDVDLCQNELAWSLRTVIQCLFSGLGSLIMMAAAVPLFLVMLPLVGWLYYKTQALYRSSAREAQRLYSITRSPCVAQFKETLQGVFVIRGFQKQAYSEQIFLDILERNVRSFYGLILMNRWFSVRIPLISATISLGLSLGLILMAQHQMILAGTAGMVLIYALRFWEDLNWLIRSYSQTEASMTSVERLQHFGLLRPEPDVLKPSDQPLSEAWPQRGELDFDGVHARYAEHLPMILKGVSFSIPGGARVGLIGRTGAGKSTIFQVLYRFIPVTRGRILIDGIDIATVPLTRLRRSLAIIPQDPLLFNGNLRDNLDRFRERDDGAIWQALESVQLATFVRGLEGGLNAEVKENGQNFSQGQRQLFCLARALLIDARIIVLDEATASVDRETDELIQATIRQAFRDRTLLIIAHRLETVADADLLIEIDHGKVVKLTSGSKGRPAAVKSRLPHLHPLNPVVPNQPP